jgi:hypothetical protein
VSENTYEKLAVVGLAKAVTFAEYKLMIENEEYEVNAAELNFDSRKKFLLIIETERQKELEKLFKNMDINPTIKEIRENFDYIKSLTEMYKLFKNEDNLYFSYE